MIEVVFTIVVIAFLATLVYSGWQATQISSHEK